MKARIVSSSSEKMWNQTTVMSCVYTTTQEGGLFSAFLNIHRKVPVPVALHMVVT